MKRYRIYLREGPSPVTGRYWGRELGADYTLENAREVKARYAASFPTGHYYIRKSA